MKDIFVSIVAFLGVVTLVLLIDIGVAAIAVTAWDGLTRPSWHVSFWEMFLFIAIISIATSHPSSSEKN